MRHTFFLPDTNEHVRYCHLQWANLMEQWMCVQHKTLCVEPVKSMTFSDIMWQIMVVNFSRIRSVEHIFFASFHRTVVNIIVDNRTDVRALDKIWAQVKLRFAFSISFFSAMNGFIWSLPNQLFREFIPFCPPSNGCNGSTTN